MSPAGLNSRVTRCDSCGKRVRQNQHEVVLRDGLTGQLVGVYHCGLGFEACQAKAAKYSRPGVVLRMSFVHPHRCGPNQTLCDAGLSEGAA